MLLKNHFHDFVVVHRLLVHNQGPRFSVEKLCKATVYGILLNSAAYRNESLLLPQQTVD